MEGGGGEVNGRWRAEERYEENNQRRTRRDVAEQGLASTHLNIPLLVSLTAQWQQHLGEKVDGAGGGGSVVGGSDEAGVRGFLKG